MGDKRAVKGTSWQEKRLELEKYRSVAVQKGNLGGSEAVGS